MRVALLATAAAALIGAGPAMAQSAPSGGAAGLRYLSWPGKAAVAQPSVAPAISSPAPETAREAGLRPAQPVYSAPTSYAAVAPSYSTPSRQGLTPASVWLNPQPQPQPAAAAPYSPTPQPVSRTLPPPVPTRVEPRVAVQPDYLPDVRPAPHGGQAAMQPAQVQPAPLPPQPQQVQGPVPQRAALVQPSPLSAQRQAAPAPQSTLVQATPIQAAQGQATQAQPGAEAGAETSAEAAADPMAPRRDAPVFRMGQPAPMPTGAPVQTAGVPQGPSYPAAPSMGSARYYSVHRQAGHQPDPTPLPQPTYLDGLPVELISPPQSADLAEPQSGPALIRNQNGTVRAAPAQTEGDFQ